MGPNLLMASGGNSVGSWLGSLINSPILGYDPSQGTVKPFFFLSLNFESKKK